jgi:hypothetical protein
MIVRLSFISMETKWKRQLLNDSNKRHAEIGIIVSITVRKKLSLRWHSKHFSTKLPLHYLKKAPFRASDLSWAIMR